MEKFTYMTEEELKKQKAKEVAKTSLLKNSITKDMYGVKITIGLAPAILSEGESANILLDNTNSEVQVVLRRNGNMSFTRRKDSTVSLLYVAVLFGGIGCESAAWAELHKHVTSRNFRKIAKEIFAILVALGGE